SMGARWTNAEIAGYIDPIVIGANDEAGLPMVIPEQLDALLERVDNYLALRNMPNQEKRLALLIWNTPEGEDNFAATHLNVPRSLMQILATLKAEGYRVDDIDEATLIDTLKRLIRPYYRTSDKLALRELLDAGLAARYPVAE